MEDFGISLLVYLHVEQHEVPSPYNLYVGVLLSLWLFQFPIFLFAAQPK
jgi:hypothetical protein